MIQKMKHWVLYQKVALIVFIMITLAACEFLNKKGLITGGADTPEAVVNTYLSALEKRDKSSILSLIPKTLIGEKAVQAKIEKLGGHDLRFAQICYLPLKPLYKNVTIQGQYRVTNGKNVKYEDQFSVAYFEQKWYLMIGQAKQPITVPVAR